MSFNTAISGLNAATTDLNVIGNNIANASTNGFKSSRTQFSDVYPVSNFGVSSNVAGAGVKVDAITQQFTQGNVNFTNSALDMAINGDGFFRLERQRRDRVLACRRLRPRRATATSSNANALRLTGYQADATGNITGALGDAAGIARRPGAECQHRRGGGREPGRDRDRAGAGVQPGGAGQLQQRHLHRPCTTRSAPRT
ncbi:MAG: flagellar hook-basal body complex protein [Chromatiales bacterium]|nr:flagellar hook-basal body complex protein [Chromatiales bacterium]